MLSATIVIPVFNKASLTRQCLDALLNQMPAVTVEIVVVDDASTDGTSHLLSGYGNRIRVVSHTKNSGFATACNDGAALASAEYVIFLNNDTVPRKGWLDALVGYAYRHPRAAAVGSKLLFPNDTIQHAGVVICQDRYPRHVYMGFPADHPAVNKSRRFQIVTAGCMLVRRECFQRVGGFHAEFHNGYEDVDLCLRLGECGREVHYCHESELYHLESVSDGRFDAIRENTNLYNKRWAPRVTPDDVQYYLDDGLLSLSYREHYPVRLTASPYLATVDSPEGVADRLLNHRARQVYDLLRDNIRLNVHVQETGFRLHEHNGAGGKQAAARNWTTHYVAPELPRFISMGQAHWLSHEPSGRLVSIILPVKNGAAGLRDLLPRLLRQKTRDTIEILAIDSGSTDDTIKVLKSFSATILSIDPQSFNHGLTRNLGVRNARGDIFVFLNQSATPQGDEWLASLIGSLDADPAIAGVCSRVLPRPDADVLTYFDGIQDPSGSQKRSLRVITDREAYGQLSAHALRLLINFHTVSAAVRPDIVRRIPFREVLIGEDILWAKEVLEAGFKIQHEPSSVVLHSHQYSYLDLFRRNVDDGIANREIVGRTLSEADIVPTISALARGDWEYLENKCALTTDDLQRWRVNSVLRRTAQIIGQWIGVNRERLPQEMSSYLSLTERIKAGAVPRSKPVENNQYENAAS